MKFALACYGTRGDIEPSVAVGRELQLRGHDVRLAVPPELVGFVEESALSAVPYGPPVADFLDADFLRNTWQRLARNPVGALAELWQPIIGHWQSIGVTLAGLSAGSDLLSTGINFEQAAANVAESQGLPLISLHHFPMRPNGRLLPGVLSPATRAAGRLTEWLFWRATREVDNAQRRDLGLPRTKDSSPQRIAKHGWLEIQAYDAASVPGLQNEWRRYGDRRPFTGALTMERPTDADEQVRAWIAQGPKPICFATGSIPLARPAETIALIGRACGRLGRRALICTGGTEDCDVPESDALKVVRAVNYATVFPTCAAVVHHGGSGTTAAGLRAAVPNLILWSSADQPYWGNQVKKLKVGTARCFSRTSGSSLIADLTRILSAGYVHRARDLATQMIPATTSIARTADLYEQTAAASRS